MKVAVRKRPFFCGNTDNPRTVTVNTAMTLTAQFTSTPTTINNTSAAAIIPQKVLRNGQVRILRGGKTYTLTGMEVK